jgi:hypothetical protein
MRNILAAITLFTLLIISGCSGGKPSANNSVAANGNSNANSAVVNANTNSASNTVAATPTMSPTEVFKAMSEASSKKDVEGIKKHFSKQTLVLFDQVAADQGKSVDQILREPDGAPFPVLPVIGLEKIDGQTATLEIGDPETDSATRLPFVIEDGEWKIAMDVYLEQVEDVLSGDGKKK